MVTKKSLDEFYAEGWELHISKFLDSRYNVSVRSFYNRMIDAITLIKEDKDAAFDVLDVGCGIGVYGINILKRYPRSKLVAFDISKKQMDYVKAHQFIKNFRGRARFDVQDATEFKLNKKFDYILCTEVLEHIMEPQSVLKRMKDHAKKDARFIISLPICRKDKNPVWYGQYTTDTKWKVSQDLSDLDQDKKYYTYYHKEYTPDESIRLLKDAGLEILETRYSVLNWPTWSLNLLYNKLIAFHWVDSLLNRITFNRFASQITHLCKSIK